MIDYFLTGRYVADTRAQRELFGDVPTVEDSLHPLRSRLRPHRSRACAARPVAPDWTRSPVVRGSRITVCGATCLASSGSAKSWRRRSWTGAPFVSGGTTGCGHRVRDGRGTGVRSVAKEGETPCKRRLRPRDDL